MPFTSLGLSEPICRALSDLGYNKPTSIQTRAIPVVLQGEDVIATAQTGTGKTASFVLPLLEAFQAKEPMRGKRIRCLILSPTHELAEQLHKNIQQYARYCDQSSMVMVGGVDSGPQKEALIKGVDFLVATPGRLIDLLHQRALYLDELEALVIDEADKMLDMGFIDDINRIIDRAPEDRQSLLFSATMPPPVRQLAKSTMYHPKEISIDAQHRGADTVEQWLVTVDKDTKSALLSHLIKENDWQQGLIFIETKHGAAKLAEQLGKRGIEAEAFHSGKSQASRERALEEFKAGKLPFLIATGIAARGLDIEALPRVINYDLPYDSDEFIHRIGRTGRAGAKGEAISLLSRDDFKNLCAIESRLGHIIERREIEGFTPRKEVPISILNYQPKNKAKAKPKKDRTSKQNADFKSASKGRGKSSKSVWSKGPSTETSSQSEPAYKKHDTKKPRLEKPGPDKPKSKNPKSKKPFNPWLK